MHWVEKEAFSLEATMENTSRHGIKKDAILIDRMTLNSNAHPNPPLYDPDVGRL